MVRSKRCSEYGDTASRVEPGAVIDLTHFMWQPEAEMYGIQHALEVGDLTRLVETTQHVVELA